MILDMLPAFQLISMSAVNQRLSFAIENVLKRNFLNKTVIFKGPYINHTTSAPETYNWEYKNYIETSHLPTIVILLNRFGRLISVLNIFDHTPFLPISQASQLYRLINTQCAATLTQLHITNKFNDIFSEFKMPFERVEYVSLQGSFPNVNNSNFSFSKIFPSIKSLRGSVEMYGSGLCDQTMPQLKSFSAESHHSRCTPFIKQLIKNNKQIQSLKLKYVTIDLLKFVANELPHLEYLAIHHLDSYEETPQGFDTLSGLRIHFEHMKVFILEGFYCLIPTNATFGRLEEFKMRSSQQCSNSSIRLALTHKNSLKKLHLFVGLNNDQILQLVNWDLIELGFSCTSDLHIGNIIELIEKSRCLEKLDLLIEWKQLNNLTFDELNKKFSHEWNVSKTDCCIFMQRKYKLTM